MSAKTPEKARLDQAKARLKPGYRPRFNRWRSAHRRKLSTQNRERALDYLGGKCMDCGHEDRRILEFDHLRDKICCVTELFLDPRWEPIQTELDKCELVCPNCHAVRTLERRPSYSVHSRPAV